MTDRPVMADRSDSIEPLHADNEKDYGQNALHMTTTLSPEDFQKLYLTPKLGPVNAANKRFANPTPLGFLGFVISTFTFSMVLMGWGGATSLSGVVGIFFFTGPVLLGLATIFEWIQGNFFPMMVCGLFTVFWLSWGLVFTPTLELAASYSATGNVLEGTVSKPYNAALAIYAIVWGFAIFTFWIFTLKTNAVFAGVFFCLWVGAFCISGAFWSVSLAKISTAQDLQKAGGALFFVAAALGWYLTVAIMCDELETPFRLPVFDLSRFWPKRKEKSSLNGAERRA